MDKIYVAIDLKSFYASVECKGRSLDPLDTNLVVADESRTEKTICLAVSPSLKSYGISGRPRLFEVIQKVKEINKARKEKAPGKEFKGKSYIFSRLNEDPSLELDFIAAPPQMAHYIDVSSQIYDIYLKYISPQDIHVYSIDEVFMDVTDYLKTYNMTAHAFAQMVISDVFKTTGITATAGIGPNLYLCKVAMDIVAKHIPPDENGVRIAEIDEISYRKKLWSHRPITDFWRVGKGYAAKLEKYGIFTMGDIARCSLGKDDQFYSEELLYRLFGVNAELLIDHAWGCEDCTIKDIKNYKPESKCIVSGQVLQSAYTFEDALLVLKEMTDLLALDLVEKQLVTNQIVLTIGYDTESLSSPDINKFYKGDITTDMYGRKIPKHAHGTANLKRRTSSAHLITNSTVELYKNIVNQKLLIRRISISANHVENENIIKDENKVQQLDLFSSPISQIETEESESKALIKENKMQKAVLGIKKKYGKNSILKGISLEDRATARDKNNRIGGHKA